MGGTGNADDRSQTDRPGKADGAERFQAFVDNSTDIFTHIRPDGEMAAVTNTQEMLGRSRQEFFETPLEEFLHPEEQARAIECLDSALDGEATSPVEARFRHGEWIWIETSMSPISSEYALDGVVTVTREITERKHREQELEEAKAELKRSNETLRRQNNRLDKFASVISHDLQNPLSVAGGRLELAQEACDNEHLDAIEQSLDRMSSMIDKLETLTISQSRVEDTALVHIASRARTAWETTETSNSELQVTIDQDIEFEADAKLLDHIFEDLFRNSVTHNQAPVTVTVGALKERYGFYVGDDGTGIPSASVDDIFEYGYSDREGGTGFGLGIVNEFVEAHGWDIAITDSEEDGARFEIYID